MCNPKDELVRMIRTCSIRYRAIRQFVVSVLKVEVKLNFPITFSGHFQHENNYLTFRIRELEISLKFNLRSVKLELTIAFIEIESK